MLLTTQRYYLLVFRTKENLVSAAQHGMIGASASSRIGPGVIEADAVAPHIPVLVAEAIASFWSKHLNAQVWLICPGEVFLALSAEIQRPGDVFNQYPCMHILHGDKTGWIHMNDWMEVKSVKSG